MCDARKPCACEAIAPLRPSSLQWESAPVVPADHDVAPFVEELAGLVARAEAWRGEPCPTALRRGTAKWSALYKWSA